jgi:predicted PurR-regulated permease PerM
MLAVSPYEPAVPTVFFLSDKYHTWINLRLNPSVSVANALPKIEAVFKKIIPSAPFDYKFADEQYALKFAEELRNSTYSNVLGQGLIAVVQGALLANGFWLAGIPDPLFWGVIGAFISFLPVVGAPTLTIPAAAILYAQGHPAKGVILLLYGVLFIGNIDNVLRMMINKRVSNTHPIITVIGVFIGLPLFGILGLVFGPLLFSYFLLLIEIYETNRLAADRLERIQSAHDDEALT